MSFDSKPRRCKKALGSNSAVKPILHQMKEKKEKKKRKKKEKRKEEEKKKEKKRMKERERKKKVDMSPPNPIFPTALWLPHPQPSFQNERGRCSQKNTWDFLPGSTISASLSPRSGLGIVCTLFALEEGSAPAEHPKAFSCKELNFWCAEEHMAQRMQTHSHWCSQHKAEHFSGEDFWREQRAEM